MSGPDFEKPQSATPEPAPRGSVWANLRRGFMAGFHRGRADEALKRQILKDKVSPGEPGAVPDAAGEVGRSLKSAAEEIDRRSR